MEICYQAIGVIHSPFRDIVGMPIQPSGAAGIRGSIEIYPDYVPGLKDLEGFSHLFLLYHFHQVVDTKLEVVPFLDDRVRGVFATRAPKRPNPIGLSIVRLLSVTGMYMEIENVDILDGTPLLDIKPCIPEFDQPKVERIGWFENVSGESAQKRSDSRFR